MEAILDIIRRFRPADGEVLRIDGAAAEPFAAVDPRHLRVEAAAGASARIVVLHYMRQRGLSEAQARRLQIEGFVGDVVTRCGIEPLCGAILERAAAKIETL